MYLRSSYYYDFNSLSGIFSLELLSTNYKRNHCSGCLTELRSKEQVNWLPLNKYEISEVHAHMEPTFSAAQGQEHIEKLDQRIEMHYENEGTSFAQVTHLTCLEF